VGRICSLEDVAEAMVINLDSDFPHVDLDRALRDPHDLINIYASLVSSSAHTEAAETQLYSILFDDDNAPKSVMQLAHCSVKGISHAAENKRRRGCRE
jgi:hypothetical protein